MASRLLDLLPHFIITVKIEDICDEVESVLVILDIGVEAGEVEAVGKVVLVNFTKVLIATRRDELENEMSAIVKGKKRRRKYHVSRNGSQAERSSGSDKNSRHWCLHYFFRKNDRERSDVVSISC